MHLLAAGLALLCILQLSMSDDCPTKMPLEIGGSCYRLVFETLRFQEASDNCKKLEEGGVMTSFKTPEVLDKLQELVVKFVLEKLENANFWIGISTKDTSVSKAAEDRTWSYHYDGEKFVQKDYQMWETEGGPKEKGLSCGAINGSNEFKVKPVDCGGPRLPGICMMEEGKTCKDTLPYLTYGPYCLAAVNAALESYKMIGACEPNALTPLKDDEMKRYVAMAAKNSFLGGGVFMNMAKKDDTFYDLSDGSIPADDMWEEGEPRSEYDCVGLSLQEDNTLKLKTMSCGFMASSLCTVMKPESDHEE